VFQFLLLLDPLIISKVQLNVNVETTIVSQIDEDKDHYHCDIEATPTDTQTLHAFEQDGHYKVMDRDSSDREDEKYPTLV
jgi:hypothetical protein